MILCKYIMVVSCLSMCVEMDVLLSILFRQLSIYGALNLNTRSRVDYDVFIFHFLV